MLYARTLALALLGNRGRGVFLCHAAYLSHQPVGPLEQSAEDFQRRWQSYVDEFGDKEDVVVVVQGENSKAIVQVLDEVAAELKKQPQYCQAVLHEIDLTKLRQGFALP